MYVDAQLLFSSAQALTATARSTNIIDLKAIRDIGAGESLYIVVQVTADFTDSGSNSTITVTLETDSVEAFDSPDTVQTLGTFGALSKVGAQLIAAIDPLKVAERYIGLRYTAGNGDLTTGGVTAFVALNVDAFKGYADKSPILG